MPRIQKGEVRNPLGRPKGIKDTRHKFANVMQILEEEGHDPVRALIEIARNGEEESNRLTANVKLLDRIAPVLKSVEHSAKEGQMYGLTVIFNSDQNNQNNQKIINHNPTESVNFPIKSDAEEAILGDDKVTKKA